MDSSVPPPASDSVPQPGQPGEPAPAGIGGTLDATLGDVNVFGMAGPGGPVFPPGVPRGSAAAGIYFYRVISGNHSAVGRMALIK